MVLIEYVGKKPIKVDNDVAKTGTVWHGPGAVAEVSDEAAKLLLKHPDVWAVVAQPVADVPSVGLSDAPAGLTGIYSSDSPVLTGTNSSDKPAPTVEEAKYVLIGQDGQADVVLDTMTEPELKAFVKKHKALDDRIDLRKCKGDALRAAILDAVEAVSAAA